MRINLIAPAVVLLVCASLAFGQTPRRKLVVPGPTGVYINLGLGLPSTSNPSKGITAYRVERREGKEKSWRQVADVQAPASREELKARLSQAMKLVPAPLRADSLPTDWIWQQMKLGADSLRVYGSLLPVRLALGIVYLDAQAPRATPLEYRVSSIDGQRNVVTSFTAETVFLPAVITFPKLNVKTSTHLESQVQIQWTSAADSPTRVFQAYRRADLAGSFSTIPTRGALSRQKDSLVLDLVDNGVQQNRIYEYFVVPMDAYGNPGLPSDTVRLATYDFALASTATYAQVEGMDSTGGLRIRWQLQDPRLVRSIALFRGEDWDRGFSAIAQLSPSTGEFIDQDVVPMKDYYYYVEAVGPLGEHARSSATMHGLYQSSLIPFPPFHPQAEPVGNGVALRWTDNEENVKGFYVYRGDASARSLHQVSPLILARGGSGTFTDSSKELSARFTYAYAVRSENTSHRLSPFSDTVYVRPGIKTSPKAPLSLRGNADGQVVQLVWEDLHSVDPALLGFKVLRRTTGGSVRGPSEFKELTDSLLPADRNHYTDLMVNKGQVYEYAVQSVDAFGGKSGMSNIVRLSVASETLLPPSGLRASAQNGGVLLEWDEASGSDVAGYRLYRYVRGGQPIRLANLKLAENEFTDTKAQKGQLYFYYVTSIARNNIESQPSAEESARR